MCEFCERFDFGEARCDISKYGNHISTAGASYRFPEYEQFCFCPRCGDKRVNIMARRAAAKTDVEHRDLGDKSIIWQQIQSALLTK